MREIIEETVKSCNSMLRTWLAIFLKNTGGQGVPEHKLQEEVDEFLEATCAEDKLMEAVDVLIVLSTQLQHDYGLDYNDILINLEHKLDINIHRKWKKNPDGTISHVNE